MQVHTERLAAGLAVVGMVLAALLGLATPALGHAVMLDSDPGDGDVVEGAPDEVVLTFSEPMQAPASVVVTGPNGDPAGEDQEAEIDGERVLRPLEGATDDGVYTVEWRAVSADDHPISGEFAFEVAAAEPDDEPAERPTREARAPASPEPATPAPTASPTPEAVTEAELAAAEGGGGVGLMVWLLGAAVLLGAVATGLAARASRRQSSA